LRGIFVGSYSEKARDSILCINYGESSSHNFFCDGGLGFCGSQGPRLRQLAPKGDQQRDTSDACHKRQRDSYGYDEKPQASHLFL
jgi:hypothetical protein